MTTRQLSILMYATLVLPFTLSSQWSLQTGLSGRYDDNINNNYLQINDKITTLGLTGSYGWESDNSLTEFFYSGTLNYYSTTIDRSFTYHTLGLNYTHLYGDEQETSLDLNTSYSMRINRNDYTLYDHTQIGASGSLSFPISADISGITGYSFVYVRMKEVPDFNYLEHSLFLQAKTFLPTHTTLIIQTDLGYKQYTSPNIDSSTTTSSGRWGRQSSSSTSSYPSVTQLIGMIRIGQAIIPGTGLSVASQYIMNLQNQSRYIISTDGIVSGDDIFDDQYSYKGPSANITLTQLLPAGLIFKLTAGIQQRDYIERPAYDLLGNQLEALRTDTRKNVYASLEKNFDDLGISLAISYEYLKNVSNDQYFNYDNNIFSIGLSYEY